MSTCDFESLISPAELADALGMSLGWVRDHWQAGELPGFVIDRRVRFRLSEVEMWLDERRRGPRPPLRVVE